MRVSTLKDILDLHTWLREGLPDLLGLEETLDLRKWVREGLPDLLEAKNARVVEP